MLARPITGRDEDLRALPQQAARALELQNQREQAKRLAAHCNQYKGSIRSRALTQIATTAIPFAAVVALMLATVEQHYWATLLLAIPGGGLLVRFFIVQHDCGHGSFFASRRWNDTVGNLMSLLTLAPYDLWRREHAHHHATSAHLEKRGIGDINTLTVAEYRALSSWGKLKYKLYRHPLFLFGLGVPLYFLIIQRLPWGHGYPAREAWPSVLKLNVALALFYGTIGYFTGYANLAWIGLPMLHVATAAGGWLFYIQHQFEDTTWERADEWTFQAAALQGSSYYELPPVLNWFTGNIGLHHIHHLNSMIPNYRLMECLKASPELEQLNRLTIGDSWKCAGLKLWDEDKRELVGFADAERPVALH